MAQFRDYLEREGVETEPVIELPLFVWANEQLLQKGLVAPRPEEGRDFTAETALLLAADPHIRFQVDFSVKVQALESNASGLNEVQVRGGAGKQIPAETLSLVDWEQAYLDILAYKVRKGWSNLVIRPETPRAILDAVPYTLVADDAVLRPRSVDGRSRLQEAVTAILRKYVDVYYRRRHEKWDSEHLVYRPLDLDDPNLSFNRPSVQEKKAAYNVRVPRSRQDIIEVIEKLRADMDKLIKEENSGLPRVYFDRSLYLPLLLKKDDNLITDPPPLEISEAQFVRDLKTYWNAEKNKSFAGKEVYLLRNLSRGIGIGFFEESGFYPDFILWVLDPSSNHQRIIFVEPHGMLHAKAYIHDEKARLWERLTELAQEIGRRSGQREIALDSYIISATSFDDLYQRYDDGTWSKEKFAEKHILFMERDQHYDYMKFLFRFEDN